MDRAGVTQVRELILVAADRNNLTFVLLQFMNSASICWFQRCSLAYLSSLLLEWWPGYHHNSKRQEKWATPPPPHYSVHNTYHNKYVYYVHTCTYIINIVINTYNIVHIISYDIILDKVWRWPYFTLQVSGPRSLQPSQWGMLCPSDTPEGCWGWWWLNYDSLPRNDIIYIYIYIYIYYHFSEPVTLILTTRSFQLGISPPPQVRLVDWSKILLYFVMWPLTPNLLPWLVFWELWELRYVFILLSFAKRCCPPPPSHARANRSYAIACNNPCYSTVCTNILGRE